MSDNQYIEKGNRMKEIREFLGFTGREQSKFADSIGYFRSNLNKIENGERDIPTSLIELLSKRYNISSDWLLFGKGEMLLNSHTEVLDQSPNVRFLNIAAFAGHSIAEEVYEVEKWIYIPGLENRSDHYGILVDGNSMIPTLNSGDFIVCYPLINIAEEFKHGQVYVIVLRDRILVKRIFIKEGNIQLISDNPFFKPEVVDQEDVLKLFAISVRITPFVN